MSYDHDKFLEAWECFDDAINRFMTCLTEPLYKVIEKYLSSKEGAE